jgi:hypothetical protein
MITKLYKGKVELDFDESRHVFSVGGEPVPSVTACTSVIDKSRPLVFWAVGLARDFLKANLDKLAADTDGEKILALIEEASRQHQVVKEEAAAAGTEAHKWAEKFIKAKTKNEWPALPKDPAVYNAVSAFLKWVNEHKVRFVSSERKVYSRNHRYAGIMDAVAVIGGKRCVVDFKTAKGFYPEFQIQVAAYQAAAEEEDGRKHSGEKWLVRFDKESGEFEARQFGGQAEDFKAFLACLALRNRLKELEKGSNSFRR